MKKLLALITALSVSFIMMGTVYAQAPEIQVSGEKTETMVIAGEEIVMTYNLDSNNNGYVRVGSDVFVREGHTVYMNGEAIATITTRTDRILMEVPQPRFSWTHTTIRPPDWAKYSVYVSTGNHDIALHNKLGTYTVSTLAGVVAIVALGLGTALAIAGAIIGGLTGSFLEYFNSTGVHLREVNYEHTETPSFNYRTDITAFYDFGHNDAVPNGFKTEYSYWS